MGLLTVALAAPSAATAAGSISGNVTDQTPTALQGICVSANNNPFGPPAGFTQTDEGGDYTIVGLAAGSYKVNFFDCSVGNYVQEWYDDQPDFNSAELVGVSEGETTSPIDAVLAPAGRISGHVEEAGSHTALQGICVNATDANADPNNPVSPVASSQTDANGEYDMGGVPGGDFKVSFSDCGVGDHVQQWYNGQPDFEHAGSVAVTAGDNITGIDASLQVGGHITGHVEDADTEADLQGICVNANDDNFNDVGFAQTDENGDYDIGGLPDGEFKVQFHDDCGGSGDHIQQWYNGRPDFDNADTVPVTAGETTPNINASLQVGGHITGHVENSDQEPLENICVEANDENFNGRGFAQTDANGDYDMGGVAPGNVKVQFHDDCGGGGNYAQQWYDDQPDFDHADLVEVTAGDETPGIDATLQPAGHITGHVENADEDPLENICVDVNDENFNGIGFAQTDSNGDYDVGGLPAGEYRVQFHDDCGAGGNYVRQWYDNQPDFDHAEPVSVTAGQTTPEIDARLQPGGRVAGHVENDADEPEPLANICVEANGENFNFLGFAQTDENGDYEIGGLPPGDVKIRFSDECGNQPNYVQQWYDDQPDFDNADSVPVTVGNTTPDVDATMHAGAHITGHVQSEGPGEVASEPLAGICVNAFGENGGGGAQTDENGEYDIGGLATGEYQVAFEDCEEPIDYALQLWDDKTWFDSTDPVAVEAPDTTPNINATMHPGAEISGHVTDAGTSQPVDRACMNLHASADESIFDAVRSAETDETGDYSFPGLPPGTYRVSFRSCPNASHHYASQWFDSVVDGVLADAISVGPGEGVTGVDAAMGGSSTFDELDEGGTLATGATATAGDPVIASVTLPGGVGGAVEINKDAAITTGSPGGFTLFGAQFVIYAPDGTVNDPLTLVFTIDASLLGGVVPSTVAVFQNGSAVANCTAGGAATTAVPDPCVKSRLTIAGGDLQITILTSHASTWNLGKPVSSGSAGGSGGGSSSGTTTTTTTTTAPSTNAPPAPATTPAPTTTPTVTPTVTRRIKCRVPKLKGHSLRKAKKYLRRAHCRVGPIRKRATKVRRLRGRVVASKPGPGWIRPAGTRVTIFIGK